MGLVRTALLDALYDGVGDGSVDCLGGILDAVDRALLETGLGAEETGCGLSGAKRADDGLTVHDDDCVCLVVFWEKVV